MSSVYFKLNRRKIVLSFLILLLIAGAIVFNKYFSFERLMSIHIEKEKKLGDEKINQQLYQYFENNKPGKYIITDYQYLMLLPEISKFYKFGSVQDLIPSDPLLTDDSTGFLLMTTILNQSTVIPGFIEDSLRLGKYTEVFKDDDHVFIKIK